VLVTPQTVGCWLRCCIYNVACLIFGCIAHMRVPSGLCSEVFVIFVGCCVSSYRLFVWISRSGLIGDAENVRLTDLHPSIVTGFIGRVLLLTWRGVSVRCLYAFNSAGLLSQSMIVESSCHASSQCTS
jgi:hypothetical protein